MMRFALPVTTALLALLALGFSSSAPKVAAPSPVPSQSPVRSPSPVDFETPTPVPAQKVLVVLGQNLGPTVDKKAAQASLDLLNGAVESGCVVRKMKGWSIPYKTTADKAVFSSNEAVYARILKGAPYALDIRWYNDNTNVMGYTYNYKKLDSGSTDYAKSETRVWTNRTIVSGPKTYAAHLAHEITHQIRTGGFVHYTQFQGTVPYEFGDIVFACLTEQKGMRSFAAPSHGEEWNALKAKRAFH